MKKPDETYAASSKEMSELLYDKFFPPHRRRIPPTSTLHHTHPLSNGQGSRGRKSRGLSRAFGFATRKIFGGARVVNAPLTRSQTTIYKHHFVLVSEGNRSTVRPHAFLVQLNRLPSYARSKVFPQNIGRKSRRHPDVCILLSLQRFLLPPVPEFAYRLAAMRMSS